jgi:hypothetical protein
MFFGSVVVVLGALLMLDYADVLDSGQVIGDWWPVVFLVAGILAYFANRRRWVMPLVITVASAVLLLRTTGVVDSLAIIGPALLVLVGLFIIFGRGMDRGTIDARDRIKTFNVFSGSQLASHSKNFEGGSVGALFGGTEIDLRDAKPAPGASLDVFVAFGGTEIKVPKGWQVVTRGLPIFGAFDNVTAKETLPADAPVLDINATVLFGGLEVKH